MSLTQGVVLGLVTNVDDPDGRGRVKVHFPWLDKTHESDWMRVATLMAGNGRGSFFMPEVNDEVLVAHEFGNPNYPIVIGFVWNGLDGPPAKHVRERKLASKNGHAIRFLDATPEQGDRGALVIEDGHGNTIVLSNGKITLRSVAVLHIEAPTIALQGPGGAWCRVITPNNNPI